MKLVKFTGHPMIDQLLDAHVLGWTGRNDSTTDTTPPSVNVREDENGFGIEVAAPGLDKNDFKVEVHNDVLTIASEKQETQAAASENEHYIKREFSYRSFTRSFALPETANGDRITATYDKGILTVSIPKKEEAKPQAPRCITID